MWIKEHLTKQKSRMT